MARKDRRIRKKRGSRSCGWGSHKKSRASGGKGGAGAAGGHKGKWTWMIKYDPGHFGRRGFEVPRQVKNVYKSINIGELDEIAERLVEEGKAKKENGKVHIDLAELNIEKVLGRGKVSKPLVVTAQSFSESAAKKIIESGGETIVKE